MQYVALLRGMHVAGHRLTNAELIGHMEALGLEDVTAFLASGNLMATLVRGDCLVMADPPDMQTPGRATS